MCTHFDAPIHWIGGRDLPNNTTDTLPVQKLVGQVWSSIVKRIDADDDYEMGVANRRFSGAWHDPPQSRVLMRTGWSRRSGANYINLRMAPIPRSGCGGDPLPCRTARYRVCTETVTRSVRRTFRPALSSTLHSARGRALWAATVTLTGCHPWGPFIAAPLKIRHGKPAAGLACPDPFGRCRFHIVEQDKFILKDAILLATVECKILFRPIQRGIYDQETSCCIRGSCAFTHIAGWISDCR